MLSVATIGLAACNGGGGGGSSSGGGGSVTPSDDDNTILKSSPVVVELPSDSGDNVLLPNESMNFTVRLASTKSTNSSGLLKSLQHLLGVGEETAAVTVDLSNAEKSAYKLSDTSFNLTSDNPSKTVTLQIESNVKASDLADAYVVAAVPGYKPATAAAPIKVVTDSTPTVTFNQDQQFMNLGETKQVMLVGKNFPTGVSRTVNLSTNNAFATVSPSTCTINATQSTCTVTIKANAHNSGYTQVYANVDSSAISNSSINVYVGQNEFTFGDDSDILMPVASRQNKLVTLSAIGISKFPSVLTVTSSDVRVKFVDSPSTTKYTCNFESANDKCQFYINSYTSSQENDFEAQLVASSADYPNAAVANVYSYVSGRIVPVSGMDSGRNITMFVGESREITYKYTQNPKYPDETAHLSLAGGGYLSYSASPANCSMSKDITECKVKVKALKTTNRYAFSDRMIYSFSDGTSSSYNGISSVIFKIVAPGTLSFDAESLYIPTNSSRDVKLTYNATADAQPFTASAVVKAPTGLTLESNTCNFDNTNKSCYLKVTSDSNLIAESKGAKITVTASGTVDKTVEPMNVIVYKEGFVKIVSSLQQSNSNSSSDAFSCGLTEIGKAYCWGRGSDRQLGNINPTRDLTLESPTEVVMPAGISYTDITASAETVCAVGNDSKVYCWGSNFLGEVGVNPMLDPQNMSYNTPQKLDTDNVKDVKFNAVYSGEHFMCATGTPSTEDQTSNWTYCWGKTKDSTSSMDFQPKVMVYNTFSKLYFGAGGVCGTYNSDTDVMCWGAIGNEYLTSPVTKNFKPETTKGTIKNVVIGNKVACFIVDSNTLAGQKLYCYGDNSYGQLGTKNNVSLKFSEHKNIAVSTGSALLENVSDVAIEKSNSYPSTNISSAVCAIDSNQTYCWGSNASGQLGIESSADGSNDSGITASNVALPISDVVRINRGTSWGQGKNLHSYGIYSLESGFCAKINATKLPIGNYNTFVCWGSNKSGQLKLDYTTGNTFTPSASNSLILSDGETLTNQEFSTLNLFNSMCIIDKLGIPYCWGSNVGNALGTSKSDSYFTSLTPVDLTNVKK